MPFVSGWACPPAPERVGGIFRLRALKSAGDLDRDTGPLSQRRTFVGCGRWASNSTCPSRSHTTRTVADLAVQVITPLPSPILLCFQCHFLSLFGCDPCSTRPKTAGPWTRILPSSILPASRNEHLASDAAARRNGAGRASQRRNGETAAPLLALAAHHRVAMGGRRWTPPERMGWSPVRYRCWRLGAGCVERQTSYASVLPCTLCTAGDNN